MNRDLDPEAVSSPFHQDRWDKAVSSGFAWYAYIVIALFAFGLLKLLAEALPS